MWRTGEKPSNILTDSTSDDFAHAKSSRQPQYTGPATLNLTLNLTLILTHPDPDPDPNLA